MEIITNQYTTNLVVTNKNIEQAKCLNNVLNTNSFLKVLYYTSSSKDLLEYLWNRNDVNILLLDNELNDFDGIQIANLITFFKPSIKVILFISNPTINRIYQAIKAGAAALKPRSIIETNFEIKSNSEKFFNSIKMLLHNKHYFSNLISKEQETEALILKAIALSKHKENAVASLKKNFKLTQKEIELVYLFGSILNSKEIASLLKISPRTVEAHLRNISEKLQCNGSKELMLTLFKLGVILIDFKDD